MSGKLPVTFKRASIAVTGVVALALSVLTAGVANAHGYTNSPPSRQYLCSQGTVQNCGPIQWEPQSVEGPGNFPGQGPRDGYLCSGGNERFHQLDDPRGGNWPATDVDRSISFTWTFTARHATENWRYYVTKPGWDPSRPLTRAALQSQPFLVVDGHGEQPPATVTHDGTLPAGTSGRQLIFAVWEIADTTNAFYSCMDVNVG